MHDKLQMVEHAPHAKYQKVLEPLAAKLARESPFKEVFEKSKQNPRFARLIKKFEGKFIAEKEEMIEMLKSGLSN